MMKKILFIVLSLLQGSFLCGASAGYGEEFNKISVVNGEWRMFPGPQLLDRLLTTKQGTAFFRAFNDKNPAEINYFVGVPDNGENQHLPVVYRVYRYKSFDGNYVFEPVSSFNGQVIAWPESGMYVYNVQATIKGESGNVTFMPSYFYMPVLDDGTKDIVESSNSSISRSDLLYARTGIGGLGFLSPSLKLGEIIENAQALRPYDVRFDHGGRTFLVKGLDGAFYKIITEKLVLESDPPQYRYSITGVDKCRVEKKGNDYQLTYTDVARGGWDNIEITFVADHERLPLFVQCSRSNDGDSVGMPVLKTQNGKWRVFGCSDEFEPRALLHDVVDSKGKPYQVKLYKNDQGELGIKGEEGFLLIPELEDPGLLDEFRKQYVAVVWHLGSVLNPSGFSYSYECIADDDDSGSNDGAVILDHQRNGCYLLRSVKGDSALKKTVASGQEIKFAFEKDKHIFLPYSRLEDGVLTDVWGMMHEGVGFDNNTYLWDVVLPQSLKKLLSQNMVAAPNHSVVSDSAAVHDSGKKPEKGNSSSSSRGPKGDMIVPTVNHSAITSVSTVNAHSLSGATDSSKSGANNFLGKTLVVGSGAAAAASFFYAMAYVREYLNLASKIQHLEKNNASDDEIERLRSQQSIVRNKMLGLGSAGVASLLIARYLYTNPLA